MKKRTASITRKTKETDVNLELNLDGSGKGSIQTGIAFFDHMLDLFTKHSRMDLTLTVKGDIEVDFHHTVEDVGICLGQAIKQAYGDAVGIQRYASGQLPMDEALCNVAVDISNRPFLSFKADLAKTKVGQFDVELAEEFFKALINSAGITAHIEITSGSNLHHMIEACFKAMGFYLAMALKVDPNKTDIPSTKGVL